MNTSALIFGIPATLIVAGLLFASPQSDSTSKEGAGATVVNATPVDEEPSPVPASRAEPVWLDNLELATSIAAESDRPLMVVFR